MVTKTVKLEDILKQNENFEKSHTTTQNPGSSLPIKLRKQKEDPPRGKPKSGRIWKNTKTRFSSIIRTKGIRHSFEQKQALRNELKRVKEASRAALASKQEEKEQRKQRRRENLLRQEENRKKSEVVQVINNPNKIKRMKKKQLRYVEKRDTSTMQQ